MSALSEEASPRQQQSFVSPRAVKPMRRRKIWLTALFLAVALGCDWMRPPSSQLSVLLYNTIVIKGYRTFLRPIGNNFIRCPYNPTCSVYSEHAMLMHGFPKGLWLTTSRLFRCTPWVKPGTSDPVPPPG